MRIRRAALAFGLLGMALALAGCTPTPGYSSLPPKSSYVGQDGVRSYYTGDMGFCWGDIAPGGPRGNICGANGARSH